MKYLLFLNLFLVGCGNLIITPRGCQSEGVVGSKVDKYDKKLKLTYYLFIDDLELKLKDLVKCQSIDKINIELTRKFFVKHTVVIHYSEVDYYDFKD